MRVVAILAAYNEERFIGGCLEHLASQGVEAYLMDNESTDRTVEIAEGYLGRGLIGVETLQRVGGVHKWDNVLLRKEELAASLDADWFIHMDPDEVRLPPTSDKTLAEAIAEVDARGYNAVNFLEFTFIPTREQPGHDHPRFEETMRYYYPFLFSYPYRVNAWKRQPGPVSLRHSGGHRVDFFGRCVYPEPFKMRHYQFLSLDQARVKYLTNKNRDEEETRRLSHNWRVWLVEERMGLPSESEMNLYTSDDDLSLDKPRVRHVMEDWALPEGERGVGTETNGVPGPEKAGPAARQAFSPERRNQLLGAERDLKLIVQRMSESRVAPLLRLKHEFRELERKYLK